MTTEDKTYDTPTKTDRGFTRMEFDDIRGKRCFISDSSLATDSAIIIGSCEQEAMHLRNGEWINLIPGVGHTYVNNSMTLTQETVAKLLPLMKNFINHYSIEGNDKKATLELAQISDLLQEGYEIQSKIMDGLTRADVADAVVDEIHQLTNRNRDIVIELHKRLVEAQSK